MTQAARTITDSRPFQATIIATILCAGVLAGIETVPAMVAAHLSLLRALDGIVLGIFIIEVILKLAANSPQPWRYFKDGWNVFDFIIVVVCLLPMESQFAVVLRLGRVLRLLRLVSALPKLQLLVGALFKSFGSMGYVGLLLGLMFYIYAIIGVHMFAGHDAAHFGNLSVAFLTLFQMITLDDWRNVLIKVQDTSPALATCYFVSFILLGTMIMLNLFIGIIMNSMTEMHAELDQQEQSKRKASEKGSILGDLAALDAQLTAVKSQLKDLRAKLTKDNP